MSFGYGVGDFLAVGQLCWKVYKKCKDSPGNYKELSSEVGALHNVMKETEELLSQQGLTPKQGVKLTTCQQGCEEVLKEFDGLLVKYESLGTNSRRTFDRMGFGMQDMTSIRLRLIANVTMLDAFNNTSSHARLENKLNLLIAEVRAGKREGSVISTQTFDTAAQNDRETWKALRRELEDIGISPSVISDKRQFIIAWFQEAVAAGKLDEDAPSDDHGSDVSLYASEDPAGGIDDETVPTRELSSMMIETPTTKQTTIRASVPSPHRPSSQPADLSYAKPPQGKANSRLRVTYLLNKLRGRGRDKQFLEAARGGDVSMMEKLLGKGVDIQTQDEEKDTALHLAAWHGREEAVPLLLFKGAHVHATNERGETALRRAVDGGNERVVRLLLEEGANVNSKDTAPLHAAANRGIKAVVLLLLDNGAEIESKDIFGYTALMRAAINGHESTVRLLLEKGAEIELKDPLGYTALMLAAKNGRESTVRLLLEKGAEIESKDTYGRTALMRAAINRHESTMRLLLEKGADVESKDEYGSTALMFAARNEEKTIVMLLLEKGADVESKDDNGETALMRAAINRYESTMRLLLEKGADVEPKNEYGSTALMFAARMGEEAIVRLLLEKGADVTTQNAAGESALDWAKGRSMRLLLQNAGTLR